jgi:hypothetical protein
MLMQMDDNICAKREQEDLLDRKFQYIVTTDPLLGNDSINTFPQRQILW